MTRTILLSLLTLSLLGCGADTNARGDQREDSQTHWLSACEDDADCGSLACTCGLCTSSCRDAAGCGQFGNDAVCAAADGQPVVALCGESGQSNLCLSTTLEVDAGALPRPEPQSAGRGALSSMPDPGVSGAVGNSGGRARGGSGSEPTPGAGGSGSGGRGSGGRAQQPVMAGTGSATTACGIGDYQSVSQLLSGLSANEVQQLLGGVDLDAECTGNVGCFDASGIPRDCASAGGYRCATCQDETCVEVLFENQCSGPGPYAITLDENSRAVLGDAYAQCASNADCALVEDSCSGCCTLSAVSSSLVETFRDNLGLACEDYEGGVCDCEPAPSEAHCTDGRCEVFPLTTGTCPDLDYTDRGTFEPASCALPADLTCGIDDGAITLRPERCDPAIGDATQTACWVPNGTLVLHEFDACELHVEVASVRECGDRIEVSIEASDLCGQCDAYSPAFLALELDTAGKSVHIAQTRTEVPCIDNPPPHQLGRRMLCEQTGGTWNANCGDSACGASQACVLDLPGCDCAADEVFIASGCMPSALCALD